MLYEVITLYSGDAVCLRWQDLGASVVRRLQKHGEVRADVSATRAHQLLESVYHGTVQQWVEAAEPPYSLTTELQERLRVVIEGLRPRGPGGR